MLQVREEFVALLKANKLTLGNWNKFARLFEQKESTDKVFYEKVLSRITNIRQRYRAKGIFVSEIEELFSPGKLSKINPPGYEKKVV